MARRTRAELLVEIERLGQVFDLAMAFQMEHGEPELAAALRDTVPDHATFTARALDGGARPSEVLAGLQQALADFPGGMLADRHHAGDAALWYAFYAEQTGRSYVDDMGDPVAIVRAVVRRGRIVDQMEYDLLNGVLTNTAQDLLSPRQTAQAEALVAGWTGPAEDADSPPGTGPADRPEN